MRRRPGSSSKAKPRGGATTRTLEERHHPRQEGEAACVAAFCGVSLAGGKLPYWRTTETAYGGAMAALRGDPVGLAGVRVRKPAESRQGAKWAHMQLAPWLGEALAHDKRD